MESCTASIVVALLRSYVSLAHLSGVLLPCVGGGSGGTADRIAEPLTTSTVAIRRHLISSDGRITI